MPKRGNAKRIIFRDAKGRFVAEAERYSTRVKSVQIRRRDPETDETRWMTVAKGGRMTPQRLAELTTRTEFESMEEARIPLKEYKTRKKYAAWDIAEQIDATKGIRRKLIRVTMDIREGKRLRKVSFYHNINSNKKRSYHIFRRMNDALGMEGLVLYKKAGGRILPDRRGKEVKLEKVVVEEVL